MQAGLPRTVEAPKERETLEAEPVRRADLPCVKGGEHAENGASAKQHDRLDGRSSSREEAKPVDECAQRFLAHEADARVVRVRNQLDELHVVARKQFVRIARIVLEKTLFQGFHDIVSDDRLLENNPLAL